MVSFGIKERSHWERDTLGEEWDKVIAQIARKEWISLI